MVLSAQDANTFTVNAIDIQTESDVAREVDLTERAIRNAANRLQYKVLYDARVIGNPLDDPQNDTKLTTAQIAYRDAFINAGYIVSLDADSGFWSVSWEANGAETLVSVYSIRTTVTPGAISDLTITLVNSTLDALTPAATVQTSFIEVEAGGDTDETDFGATASTYYEYIAVVRQQDPTLDYSTNIRTALTSSSLGYVDTPSNIFVYKLT